MTKTQAEWMAEALAHAKAATITSGEWVRRVKTGRYVLDSAKPNAVQRTAWFKALTSLDAAAHPGIAPTPPPQPTPPAQGSVFSGKGAFTTSEPAAANGLNLDWLAVQADPEGNTGGYNGNARLCYWQARATQTVVNVAKARGIPYIGQAENAAELSACLALNTDGLVAKALVGNPRMWMTTAAPAGGWSLGAEAALKGWDGISEWYMNAHPWEHEPDGGGYPRFVNVCFGIYSEGEPGGQGYVAQIPLSDYTAVWHGSYSVWKAEALTPADRALING